MRRKKLHRRELRDARLTVGKANAKQSKVNGKNNEGDYMIYKGQKLSDNLTKSQRDMFKYMIDRGDSIEEIMKIYTLDDKVKVGPPIAALNTTSSLRLTTSPFVKANIFVAITEKVVPLIDGKLYCPLFLKVIVFKSRETEYTEYCPFNCSAVVPSNIPES